MSTPSWWYVPGSGDAGDIVDDVSTVLVLVWMLTLGQWSIASWAVATIKTNDMLGLALPVTRKAQTGLCVLLVGLYALQFWLLWEYDCPRMETHASTDNWVVLSCFPATHMLKSIVFLVGGPVLLICFLISCEWPQHGGPQQEEEAKDPWPVEEGTCAQAPESPITERSLVLEGELGDQSSVRDSTSTKEQSTESLQSSKSASPRSKASFNQTKDSEMNEKLRKIVPYLNNLKVFLIVYVISGHCAETMVMGLGALTPLTLWPWEYAEQMLQDGSMGGYISAGTLAVYALFGDTCIIATFFFVSGYFCRRALIKKGRRAFIFERSKRLAIPFVCFTFFWFPYILFPLCSMLFIGSKYIAPVNVHGWSLPIKQYLQTPSVLWFLAWLMLFSVIYALLLGPNWEVKRSLPRSLLGMYVLMGTIGAIPTSLFHIAWSTNQVTFIMPRFSSKLLLYAFFFFGGIVAGMNRWLDVLQERLQNKKQGRIIRWTTYVPCFVLFVPLVTVRCALNGTMSFLSISAADIWPLILFSLFEWLVAITGCASFIVFFLDYFNWMWPKVTLVIWAGTYAAYIIHPPFVMIGTYLVTLVSGIDPATVYVDMANPYGAMIDPTLLWPYFLLSSVFTVLASFIAGFAMRSLPYMDKIF